MVVSLCWLSSTFTGLTVYRHCGLVADLLLTDWYWAIIDRLLIESQFLSSDRYMNKISLKTGCLGFSRSRRTNENHKQVARHCLWSTSDSAFTCGEVGRGSKEARHKVTRTTTNGCSLLFYKLCNAWREEGVVVKWQRDKTAIQLSPSNFVLFCNLS